MIESIELTNWRTHAHTAMSFQKGVNVLVGVMGAGKSSVMDAISFALFGTFPALSHRRTSLENIIASRPSQAGSAEVRLRFGVDADTYTITRGISRGGATEARLDRNGAYLQAQPERVNEEIERLLKVDYETFSRVVYSEQNRLAYFLDLAKGERKKQIDHMLGLDSFARAEENATSLINSIRGFVLEDGRILAGMDLAELKGQLAKLSEGRQRLVEEKLASEATAGEARGNMEALGKRLYALKELYEIKKRLTNEISALQSRVATLKEGLDGLKIRESDEKLVRQRLGESTERAESMDRDMKAMRKEHEALAKELGSVELGISTGMKNRSERDKLARALEKKPEELQEASERMDSELRKLMNDSAALKAKRAELASWIGELEKHITACPICNRELGEELKGRLLSEKSTELANVERTLAQCGGALSEAARKAKDATAEHSAAKAASERITQLGDVESALERLAAQEASVKAKLAEISARMETASAGRDGIGKELGTLNNELEAISKKRGYESEVARAMEAIGKKGKERDALALDESELDSVQDSMRKESARLGDADAKIANAGRMTASIDAQIADKAKQISSMDSVRQRIEQRRSQVSELTKFKAALVETEALLRNQLVMSINSTMQGIWGELYPYADYTAIRLNATKDDYALEARAGAAESGAWVDVDAIASGGERSMACLAMRIAMAMATVPNLRWLILDEPTHNIDEQGIARIIEIFGSTLPGMVEQIFIITHDPELKNIGSARVYLLERNKERNESTSVSEL